MKFDEFFSKIYYALVSFVAGLSKISWVALIVMICIGGGLMMIGNEHGAQKVWKRSIYGYLAIQLAHMLL